MKMAVQRIKEYYDQCYRWVVEADIDAFFDTVDHDLLITTTPVIEYSSVISMTCINGRFLTTINYFKHIRN